MRRILLMGPRVELLMMLADGAPAFKSLVSDAPPRLDDVRRPGRVDIKMEIYEEPKKTMRERFGRPPRNLGKGGRQYKNTGRFYK